MDALDASGDRRLDEAEYLLADLLARRKVGDRVELDSLLGQRPDLEAELRQMWSELAVVDEVLDADARQTSEGRVRLEAVLQSLAASRGFSERYAIETEIGRGGMGVILRVIDRQLERPLAMKVIVGQVSSSLTGKTPPTDLHRLVRFLNEARITSQLDHPGIVPVHEVGVDEDGRAYFTMKLVQGLTLSEIFDRRTAGDPQWSTARVLGAIQRVCDAVAFAHGRGVIHRDLKPQNVMIGGFGEVYVMDWGLARRCSAEEVVDLATLAVDEQLTEQMTQTRAGRVLGTPAYMSPEQARGQIAQMGPQSDVYSIGAMLYQLIAGHAPYMKPGEKSSGAAILARVITGPPTRLYSTETPPDLIAICEKAMSYERESRYSSVLEVAEDLQRFIDGHVVQAFHTGAWQETQKWIQRNKALAASLAGAVVLLVAGLTASLVFKARADERGTHLRVANEAVQATNRELTLAKNAAEAKAHDVLSLSAIQDLQHLIERADELWPPTPDNLRNYEDWLRDARLLVDGRKEDEARGVKAMPSLSDHKGKLANLEATALPQSEEERAMERMSDSRASQLESEKAQALWMSRMLGDSRRPREASVLDQMSRSQFPSDAREMNDRAWEWVNPDGVVFGNEVQALVLARRAVEIAPPSDKPGYRDTLAWALFANGLFEEALSEERRAVEEASDDNKVGLENNLGRLQDSVQTWSTDDGRAGRRVRLTELTGGIARLELELGRRRTWKFSDGQNLWWHAQLAKLVSGLESFVDPKTGLLSMGFSKEHGWGVEMRVQMAKAIAEKTVDSLKANELWDEAIAAVRVSPRYGGLLLTKQVGLLPIGPDPTSGLWEFAHVQSGESAQRGADGQLVLKEQMGLVFVLIPGGTFQMGASTDHTDQNYDPNAREDELPLQSVTLDPFFLSKYEMTQGQWIEVARDDPSQYGPRTWIAKTRINLLHPVESVTWSECSRVLYQLGLTLPTEAQWEYAARAGTSTPWWTGNDVKDLAAAANVADESTRVPGSQKQPKFEKWNDGYPVHAPIGRFRANAFGLHDVSGNVAEWCRDWSGGYQLPLRKGDGERQVVSGRVRVVRGGSFWQSSDPARSAYRDVARPEFSGDGLGVRPARALIVH